ncbi:MAG TPA: ornithine carbamoyltransferase [Candidatus Izemoplasmatales bacterium]|nr:ornithine carbamoyltransferase [Candidatus Izemoplasmatales bacterium]
MSNNFKGRSLKTLLDYTQAEIYELLDIATDLKDKKHHNKDFTPLKGKNVVLLFEKDSTRTRCAFEVSALDLGMGATYLGPTGSQMGKKESIADTARVLGRMYDGIEYRGYSQKIVDTLSAYAGVPVWNGLTNEYHPTQVLADLMTIREKFGHLEGLTLAYFGDARYNMGNSLMIGCAIMGMHFRAVAPKSFWPDQNLVKKCQEIAGRSGGSITLTESPAIGANDADVVYTDVWVSMGEADTEWQKRIEVMKPYRVTKIIMDKASKKAIFMHCLPAFHNTDTIIGKDIFEKFGIDCMEVTDEVFESPQSVVFDEAENRLHTIKAIMYASLAEDL